MTPLLRLLATSVLTAALLPACAAPKKTDAPQRPPLSQRADVQNWVADTAQRNNLDAQWLQAQLAQARFLPQVPRLMTPAPKTTSTAPDWASYRNRFIEPIRIRAGVQFWNEHADTLARAEACLDALVAIEARTTAGAANLLAVGTLRPFVA